MSVAEMKSLCDNRHKHLIQTKLTLVLLIYTTNLLNFTDFKNDMKYIILVYIYILYIISAIICRKYIGLINIYI